MKKFICILIFGVLIISCNNSSKEKHKIDYQSINKKISLDSIKSDIKYESIMTSSSSFEPAKNITVNGIDFKVVEKEKFNVTFCLTTDKKFKTPEGYSIGTTLKDISEPEKNQIYKEAGFGYFIKLKSGWQLAFCEGKSCTDSFPNENSTVKWIMHRK